MPRFLLSTFAIATCLLAADDPVFKTDVALTRVDAQVLDREGQTIANLQADDFVLRMNGKLLPIRNFASENMPLDVLLLLDVSGSMQPHVQRIASAAQQALNVLAENDRVAIMVFDTRTRVRLPFGSSRSEVTGELNRVLRSERFNGGTRVTQALVDAANYVGREARPQARRAIVILTDDQTQDGEDEARVEAALTRANTVLSFLQAPYEHRPGPYGGGGGGGRRRGTWGSGGGWPGGRGGGWPGGGGIGFPGGGGPVVLGPGGGMDPSHSAGTATIARDSGGDTMQVEAASALEETLARLRRRYALYFYLPEGLKSGGSSVQVDLSEHAKFRYSGAEIRSRRVYLTGGPGGETTEAAVVTQVQKPIDIHDRPTIPVEETSHERRKAVNESSGSKVNTISDYADVSEPATTTTTKTTPHSGWPRINQ